MDILGLFASFAILMLAVSVHEFAHAFTAYKFGDLTAKHSGRLTLNPLAHIDPIGTVILPLLIFTATHGRFVFGAAKPVPINYSALKNPKRDIIWVGLSGPAANFIFALALSIIYKLTSNPLAKYLLFNLTLINVVLGTFNLIPIPPLDGSRVIMGLLPKKLSLHYAKIEPFGFIIILLLIWLGMFDIVVSPLIKLILNLLIMP